MMIAQHKMKSFVRELKVAGVATVFGLAWFIAIPVMHEQSELMRETRTYRDVSGLSPFKDVEVTRTTVTSDGTNKIEIEGTFVKVRCTRNQGQSVWTRGLDGHLYSAVFDFNREAGGDNVPRNRPPSGEILEFGPWFIYSLIPDPVSAIMFVSHDCPEGETTNMVFEIPWENSNNPDPVVPDNTVQPYIRTDMR